MVIDIVLLFDHSKVLKRACLCGAGACTESIVKSVQKAKFFARCVMVQGKRKH